MALIVKPNAEKKLPACQLFFTRYFYERSSGIVVSKVNVTSCKRKAHLTMHNEKDIKNAKIKQTARLTDFAEDL